MASPDQVDDALIVRSGANGHNRRAKVGLDQICSAFRRTAEATHSVTESFNES